MDAWTKAGWISWIVKALGWAIAAKLPKCTEYKKFLYDFGLCLLRQTFLRKHCICFEQITLDIVITVFCLHLTGNLAMSINPKGGFYSDAYVLPLHKLSTITDESTLLTGQLPNQGKMTIYDGVIRSIFSGEQNEWDRKVSILFANLEKNMSLSLLKIKSETPDIFDFRSDEMYDNFVKSSDDVCVKAENKFIIRFHSSEMQLNGFEAQSREFIVKTWYESYEQKCWIH